MIAAVDILASPAFWWTLAAAIHVLIQLFIVIRVIMRPCGVGETLAWIMVVFVMPVVGPILYLLVGELRLGARRSRLIADLAGPVRQRLNALDPLGEPIAWKDLGLECEQLARAGRNSLQVPALPGNLLELVDDWQKIFDELVRDIDKATVNCDLEFYIWNPGGRSEDVVAALERACARGVTCRILLDSLGSRPFFRSDEARRLRDAGAHVLEALPGRLWRIPFARYDLRMHRKIVVIDDRIAWTGSLNLVDPRFFKRQAGVGQWIDAMVRIRGPAVEALAITFQSDWHIESGSESNELPDLTHAQTIEQAGNSTVQVLPSGPAFSIEAIEQILIMAIYSAREELIITTPYFVPGEPLYMALASAAQRGVRVVLILPARVDSMLVRYASRVIKGRLLRAGVQIALFEGGLLHTKSVSIDGKTCLFGSMNLDPRSLRLNFEITMAVFDRAFAAEVRKLQQSYLRQSTWMDADTWSQRPVLGRFAENLAWLLSPLL